MELDCRPVLWFSSTLKMISFAVITWRSMYMQIIDPISIIEIRIKNYVLSYIIFFVYKSILKNNSPFVTKFSRFTINLCYLQTVFLFIKIYYIFATILYNFLRDIFIKVLTAERPRIIGHPPSCSPLGYIGAVDLIHHITINTRQRKILP